MPVGDAAALAEAMAATLEAPLPAATLRAAVAEYDQAIAARRYLAALGLDTGPAEPGGLGCRADLTPPMSTTAATGFGIVEPSK